MAFFGYPILTKVLGITQKISPIIWMRKVLISFSNPKDLS